jgi:hypothetical protein
MKTLMIACVGLCAAMTVLGVSKECRADVLASWSFNEGAGTTVYDSSGNGNNGTLTSSSMWFAPSYDGSIALSFPGYSGNGYVSVPDSPSLHPTGGIYLSAWVKPSAQGSMSFFPIICKGSSGNAYGLGISNNQLEFQVNYQTGGQEGQAFGNLNVPFDQWSHVEALYDRQHVTLYVNGQLDVQVPMTYAIVNNSQPLFIGYDPPGFAERYKGLIDNVVVATPEAAPVPEPISLVSGAIGLACIGAYVKRRRRK